MHELGLSEEDWDTHDKIALLNRRDASYNNKTIDEIESLIA